MGLVYHRGCAAPLYAGASTFAFPKALNTMQQGRSIESKNLEGAIAMFIPFTISHSLEKPRQ